MALRGVTVLVAAAGANGVDNGRARRPPMGWRDWNEFGCHADQQMMETTFRAMVDRTRLVNGTHKSLLDLGYSDVGLVRRRHSSALWLRDRFCA